MKKRLFPLLVALSALAVSGSAAFYSVFGLSKLFAGAATQVIIMAGSLEFAKLVVASLLYQYWDTIGKILKAYLMVACFVLMVITSGGIYGFLSGAYQSTATQSELLDKSLLIINQKQIRFQETKKDLTIEKTQINKSISDLRMSLSNPQQVSWYDKNSETVITSTSSSARRALQSELKTTIEDRDGINLKIEAVMDSINRTDMVLLDKEISNEAESELGPLKYLAETTGYPMGQVVNWFLLLIIFVFDPLAIALVVASNMAFAQIKKPEEDETEEYFKRRNKELEKIVMEEECVDDDCFDEEGESLLRAYEAEMSAPEGMGFNKPYTIPTHDPQTGELNPYYKDMTGKDNPLQEEGEERMNIIGQNGNDGLHYGKEHQEMRGEEYFTDLEECSKFKNEEEYTGEPERLTDTTQTLIVKELDDNSEETITDEKSNEETTKILRYTKDRQ